jgi:cellulose synthase/poly-beta-1,6-N-acetylglucosamine synthase-like glycosyltransferase
VVPDAIRFDMPDFHRTKVINDLTRMATNPYVFNWDADVLVSPYSLYRAVKELREGKHVVYPYDGTFYMVDRKHLPDNLNSLQSLVNCPKVRVSATVNDRASYGGAVGYNVEAFWKAGGENENLINYGHDDQERWRRFNLILDVVRVPGALYHINHWRGENSSFRHLHGQFNLKYWKMLEKMNDDEIIEHIKTFKWLK